MLNKKYVLYAVVALVLGVIVFNFVGKNGEYETYTVERGLFSQVAEVNGKVKPAQDLNLAFEVAGKISNIYVDTGDFVEEGDVLLQLDSSEVSSELSEVLANLERERSKLAEISGNSTSQNELQNSAENLLAVIKKTYVNADDVVKNNIDVFFDDPNTRTPEFTKGLSNFFLREEINDKRVELGNMLDEWKQQIDILDPAIIDNQDANNAVSNLRQVEDLLATISSGVDDFSTSSSLTQTQIDSYISGISSSRSTISSLVVELNSAYDSFRNVQAELPVVEASVENARASVEKLSTRRSKYTLRAPFSGIITEQELELGQVVNANESVLSMISGEAFEIEAFVPELNIIGLDVGDQATLKLDAFGPDFSLDAEVSHVDPRETIKDGITTYRILLGLLDSNEEIRSGMTVDIELVKETINDRIVIPRYLISSDDQGDYVKVLNGEDENRKNIVLGDTDGKGGVIIESGLSVGDKIIINK